MQALYAKHGVNTWIFGNSMLQIPSMISMFYAVQKRCGM